MESFRPLQFRRGPSDQPYSINQPTKYHGRQITEIKAEGQEPEAIQIERLGEEEAERDRKQAGREKVIERFTLSPTGWEVQA